MLLSREIHSKLILNSVKMVCGIWPEISSSDVRPLACTNPKRIKLTTQYIENAIRNVT